MKKIFISFFAILLLALICVGCASNVSYRNDVSCRSLAEDISQNIPVTDGYSEYSEEYLEFLLDDNSLHDDFSIFYSVEANDINEIGVFHCPDQESAQTLEETVISYIEEQQLVQKSFIQSYAPGEIPKLEDAEVRRYGNYVVYLILDKAKKNEAWSVIENILKK